jgi:hypothetical protein
MGMKKASTANAPDRASAPTPNPDSPEAFDTKTRDETPKRKVRTDDFAFRDTLPRFILAKP